MVVEKYSEGGGGSWTIWLLTFLYFIQGLPYGFQDKVIPLYLRDQGLNYTRLSLSKLLLVPWFCKALFAPLVDKFSTHSTWLLISLYSLGGTALLTAVFFSESFVFLAISLFVLNIFTAIQDISVDAVALTTLKANEVGSGNSAQVVGYKLGAVFGGGFLFWVQARLGIEGLFYCLSLMYFIAAILYKFIRKGGQLLTPSSSGHPPSQLSAAEYFEGFFNRESGALVLFVLSYKLGESACLSTLPIFLIDSGVSKESLVFWNNVVGQTCSLLGSVLGGVLLRDDTKVTSILCQFSFLRMAPVFGAWLLVLSWPLSVNYVFTSLLTVLSVSTLLSLHFIGGVISTATFSLMFLSTQCRRKSVQATHYSTLASIEVFGKVIFCSLIGFALDAYGFPLVYFALFVLTALPLYFIPPTSPTKPNTD